ncbi:MAG: NAD(P)/FAD-dependent oxidoreductase [Alphaproteobacteria bacterium]
MPLVGDRADYYNVPIYALTANRLLATLGSLKGEVNCDICVVGAGFTGLSAAFELALKGFSVIILERTEIGSGAAGRNGGQLIRGFAQSPDWLTEKYGAPAAKFMSNVSLEGLALILARINNLGIKCDLKFGHMTAALEQKHMADLKGEIKAWEKIGHDDLQMMGKDEVQDLIKTKAYIGGMFDPKGAHIHPLNYALGLAQAAQKAGAKIYDHTTVLRVIPGDTPKVVTSQGSVTAKYVILAGAIGMEGAKSIRRKSITATAHMIATEPLGERRARNIMGRDIAVSDARFIMDYYRLSGDYRVLFGGNCNYSDKGYAGEDQRLRQRMIKIFPQLQSTRIDNCWSGQLEFTINRMPALGRLSPTVYYAHGFGGHGVIATNILGKIMADAVSGQAQRFDVFAKIKHQPFLGGDLLKRPLFVLGMTWYRLRDML